MGKAISSVGKAIGKVASFTPLGMLAKPALGALMGDKDKKSSSSGMSAGEKERKRLEDERIRLQGLRSSMLSDNLGDDYDSLDPLAKKLKRKSLYLPDQIDPSSQVIR